MIETLLLAALLASGSAASQARDLRSVELVDYDCQSAIGGRRTTLFANGTLRLRIREGEETRMVLKELTPDQLTGYLNRLREVDLSESESISSTMSGDWVEQCELDLDLHESPRDASPHFSFGRYDSVDLALKRVINIAEEISLWAEEQAIMGAFPRHYRPRPGDILERRDGVVFEVIAYTSDKRGIELWGVEQPLVIYVGSMTSSAPSSA